jgi:ABC-type nitrate/sulfonate/bicarbonate transport system permease component
MRTGMGLALVAAAVLLAVVGLGFCLWAAYQAMSAQMGATAAALLIGVFALLLAGLTAWIAIQITR